MLIEIENGLSINTDSIAYIEPIKCIDNSYCFDVCIKTGKIFTLTQEQYFKFINEIKKFYDRK